MASISSGITSGAFTSASTKMTVTTTYSMVVTPRCPAGPIRACRPLAGCIPCLLPLLDRGHDVRHARGAARDRQRHGLPLAFVRCDACVRRPTAGVRIRQDPPPLHAQLAVVELVVHQRRVAVAQREHAHRPGTVEVADVVVDLAAAG